MLSSDDGGAIYTAPDMNSLSTWDSIHHNIIINSKGSIKGTSYKEAEAVGIYIDEPQSGGVQENWVIKDNSVSNTYYGIYLHDARNCKIESNLLFKCSSAILMNDEKQSSGDYRMTGVSIDESSILAENNSVFLFMVVDAYSNFTYPANSNSNVFANQEESNFVHTYNHSNGNNGLYTLNQWNTLSSLDQNSIITKVPSQFNKKVFIYNPTYKSSIVTFSEGCQYRTLLNEEVNQTVVLEPYMAGAFYATSSTGADCTPLVEENPLNSPPVVNVPTATQSIIENASLIFSAANSNSISISDPDNNTSTLTITAINGTFSFSGTSGLTFSVGDGSNDVTMICSGLITNLNNAFTAAVFKPTSGFAGSATLLINAKDGGGESDNGTVNISVAGINDAPVVSVPSAVQNTSANNALVFSAAMGNRISVVDPDNTSSTVTITVTNGTFSLSGTSGLSFTSGDGTRDLAMTFSGLITSINSILNGSVFTPNTGYSGAASITVSVNDGQGKTDSENISVSVSSLPNAINKVIKKLLSFYPNPACDHIIIRFDEYAINKGNGKLELLNINGQVVQSSTIENIETRSEVPVDLSGHKSGTYLIVLTLGNDQQISKLIISNPNGEF
jgi:parallel beta-helix repeat protein